MQKCEASLSKLKYRVKGKLEMGKPFAFSLFEDFDLVVTQTANEIEEGNVKFSMKSRGQYCMIAFSVKITQHREKCYCCITF